MKPSIGRIVLYHGDIVSNGMTEHPAIINRVWSDNCVNLTVFPDCGIVQSRTSVVQDEGMVQSHGWRWPPRVE